MTLSNKQKTYGILSLISSLIFSFFLHSSLELNDIKEYIEKIKEITSLILTIFSIWFGMMKYEEIRESSSSFLKNEKYRAGDHVMAFVLCCLNLIFYILITIVFDIIYKKYPNSEPTISFASSYITFLSTTILIYALHVCLRPIIHIEQEFVKEQKTKDFQRSHFRTRKMENDE